MPDKTQNPAEGTQPAGPKFIIVGAVGAELVSLITQKIVEADPSAIVIHLEQDPAVQIEQLKQEIIDQATASTTTIAEQVRELVEAEKLLATQKTAIDELTARIAELEKNPSTVPTFTLGTGANRKTYEVHTQTFNYQAPGDQTRKYSVDELLKDTKLQAALVKKGVGFIIEKA